LCYDLGADAGARTEQIHHGRRDLAMTCAGLVAQRLMLSAARRGIDSCPMIGFDYEAVGKLLHKPATCLVLMIVALGKRREPLAERAPRIDVKDLTTYNTLTI
jgi:nitroreductase